MKEERNRNYSNLSRRFDTVKKNSIYSECLDLLHKSVCFSSLKGVLISDALLHDNHNDNPFVNASGVVVLPDSISVKYMEKTEKSESDQVEDCDICVAIAHWSSGEPLQVTFFFCFFFFLIFLVVEHQKRYFFFVLSCEGNI